MVIALLRLAHYLLKPAAFDKTSKGVEGNAADE
jgi:hypothetical protein